MMSAWHAYPGTYIDNHGTDHVVIFNDGWVLEVEIRGVRFRGNDFDGLEVVDENNVSYREKFVLNKGELCDCTITCDMPQAIGYHPHGYKSGTLHLELRLGKPAANGGIDLEELRLTISYDGRSFSSGGTGGLFESELIDLKKQLLPGHFFLNCFGCAYSDYFYGGQGLFGSMFCFRNCKSEYLSIRSKGDYIKIFEKNAGWVQETHVCPQFAPRAPNTGYRG